MKIKYFLLIFCVSISSYSQEFLTGTVSYINDNNKPVNLEGVSIYWLDSSVGVVSDQNGFYSIPFEKTNNK